MNFDLNIENYTRDELIQMFELPNNFDKNPIMNLYFSSALRAEIKSLCRIELLDTPLRP